MPALADHEAFMRLAIEQALVAEERGDAPIGAVIVRAGAVIGAGSNSRTTRAQGALHAELGAILDAGERLGRRPDGVTLYSTLEPCAMCLGAVVFAGIREVVYGAEDPLGGAVAMFRAHAIYREWMPQVTGGVLERECLELRLRAMGE